MGSSISNASTYFGSNEARGKAIEIYETTAIAGTNVIHTVTAGKTFFLIACSLAYHGTINSDNDDAYIYHNLAGNIILHCIASTTATYKVTDSGHAELTFPLPIPIPSGDTLVVRSTTADITAYGTVIGWEE